MFFVGVLFKNLRQYFWIAVEL